MNIKLTDSAKTYWLLTLITLVPLCFSLFFETQREEDFIFVFLSSAILFFPLYFIKRQRIYLSVVFFFLLVPAFLEFTHIFLYQGRITQSIFFIIFDTNPIESFEYIESNLTWPLVLSCMGYLGGALYLFKKVMSASIITIKMNRYKFLVLFIILPFFAKLGTSHLDLGKTLEAYRRSNHMYSFIHNFIGYRKQIARFNSLSSRMKTDLEVIRTKTITEDEVHLLVIGESTTSTHMGIYGYHRNTTPELEKLKSELNLFTDVVSSDPPGTMANLKKILTLANTEVENDELLSINIVNVMKSAGFKTYWVSNQLILGTHDTTTTVFAKQADKVTFTNTTNSTTYDEKVLPILGDYLKEKESKKFIVVHLFGTHMKYRNRFPDSFEKFTKTDDIPKRDFHNERKLKYINDYDNAVVYHDSILSKIVHKVKEHGKISTITYLSDHGEEVYDLKNVHGHPSTAKTLNMYKIPMFIWSSNKLDLKQYLDRKYVSDDVIHSVLQLLNVKFDGINYSKSVLSPSFIEKD